MTSVLTFPSGRTLAQEHSVTPGFMRPGKVPYAVSLEGFLSAEACDQILISMGKLEPYRVKGCGAITRECHSDQSLVPIERLARTANEIYFGFDLDEGQHSWMQTYEAGMQYQRHMDGSPGQTRKLTAVALLSDKEGYDGGNLILHSSPRSFQVPRTRGTVVVFQPWVEHEVSLVKRGLRQTINMGFWGPPFR